MKARVGVRKHLYYFDATGAVLDADLLTSTLKRGTTTVASPTFAPASSIVLNLYRAQPVLLTRAGQHELLVSYDGGAVWSAYVGADLHPVTDHPIGTEVLLKCGVDGLGDAETVSVRVVGPDGTTSASISAPYASSKAAYQAPYTFDAPGDYCVVWYRVISALVTPFRAEPVYVAPTTGREVIRFVAATYEGNGSTPHVATSIVVSDENGVQVARTVTDDQGKAVVELPPGEYIASLIRAGRVFSTNNISFTVDDGVTPLPASTIQLVSEVRSVTDSPPGSDAPLCRLYGDFFRMGGQPLRNATVRVALLHRPLLFTGVTVFDTDLSFQTDSNGHVEFDLVQGLQVEISVAPLSLRRIITVPSGDDAADPVNFVSLMGDGADLFDIITPNIPAAYKRSM